MRIDQSINPIGYLGVDPTKTQDPFDLQIKVIGLKNEHRGLAPITSVSLCTPGCGNTGTGNSFCCRR